MVPPGHYIFPGNSLAAAVSGLELILRLEPSVAYSAGGHLPVASAFFVSLTHEIAVLHLSFVLLITEILVEVALKVDSFVYSILIG